MYGNTYFLSGGGGGTSGTGTFPPPPPPPPSVLPPSSVYATDRRAVRRFRRFNPNYLSGVGAVRTDLLDRDDFAVVRQTVAPAVTFVSQQPTVARVIPIEVAVEREPDILNRYIAPVVTLPPTTVVTTPTGQPEVIPSTGLTPFSDLVPTTPPVQADILNPPLFTEVAEGASSPLVKYGLLALGGWFLLDSLGVFGSKPKHPRAGRRRTGRVKRTRRARR